ncbi:MAG: RagB/SusD family nutrient uptake outer membrane protein [Bacteroidales bacterium]|nr:RagB/SusD family nutrient uptake outer membrane protein [Bacteroidales bacterium]
MKKYIVIICALLFLGGCHEDFLTEEAFSNLTPLNFYKTEADAKAALTSVYNTMLAQNGWGRQVWLAAEYPGEASWPNNSGEAWRTELDRYTWTTSSTGFSQVWGQLYIMINRANTLLFYIDQVNFSTADLKEQITGETRFLRGLAYLYLIRFFDHVPYMTEENLDELYPSNAGTDDLVWDLIIDDFTYAKSVLKPKNTGADNGRATAGAAHTMLVKAYTTLGGKPWYRSEYWSLAATEATAIMNNSEYGYDLEDDYGNVFLLSHEHGPEYIFSLECESTIGCGRDYPTFTGIRNGDQIKLGGWSSLISSVYFFNTMNSADKRREKTFVLSYNGYANPANLYTYPGNITLPHFNKFIDMTDIKATGTADYAMNLPIARFSDVLMMQSEAENEANGPSETALIGINVVRERAGLSLFDPADFTKDALRDSIIQERTWEFCEEGQAYFDLKRMDKIIERITPLGFIPTEKHYVFPIPQEEMDANPNLVQNEPYR